MFVADHWWLPLRLPKYIFENNHVVTCTMKYIKRYILYIFNYQGIYHYILQPEQILVGFFLFHPVSMITCSEHPRKAMVLEVCFSIICILGPFWGTPILTYWREDVCAMLGILLPQLVWSTKSCSNLVSITTPVPGSIDLNLRGSVPTDVPFLPSTPAIRNRFRVGC